MIFNSNQCCLNLGGDFSLSDTRVEYRDVIIDRKSKYSVVAFEVKKTQDIKLFLKDLVSDSYFRKASHNSSAYRIVQENGSIIEGKNDDGEQGAGMCILRELQRENASGILLIVTRYFGGIQLHSDRFKNIIDSCKIFFEKQKKK